ncbi:hypothetical protein BKA62DRAFT_79090 [Auriculariales sp. MPI-PUGE-AT-0066]|nr:hypothetical protein BKA62DRAFT_79090 [Auriculariales sp. MPI-PUGE-AT-0066]
MKETKTAKAGTDCPTLLHYLARVLMRSNERIILFVEELPHVEAAARVSVQTVLTSVSGVTNGLEHVKDEIKTLKQTKVVGTTDRFTLIMEPFVAQVTPQVQALQNMSSQVNQELRELLVYFGEQPDGAEGIKPEDFFGMVMSFSSALQKAALRCKPSHHQRQQLGPRCSWKKRKHQHLQP